MRRLTKSERLEEARAFLLTFFEESGLPQSEFKIRWREVRQAIKQLDYYEHTREELTFGARIAWRNHARCIGRLYWDSLEVYDCRNAGSPDEIATRMFEHMRESQAGGRVRSMISVFAPIRGNQLPAYIESPQIIQYAGYVSDGQVVGDRKNVEATRIAIALGFSPPEPPTMFDILPLVIRDENDRRCLVDIPPDVIREVQIVHPEFENIGKLVLKWYSVPYVSGMILTIGGIEYPCAPFNGFYMVTEIGSRNLADEMRYNVLPLVSQAIGDVPTRKGTSLWKDRAITELNRAVLHSFRSAGISMSDHHTESSNFTRFCQRERMEGRDVAADWSWIVPPHASATCDVFHLKMQDFGPVPNFYYNAADDGKNLMPYYGNQQRSRISERVDRLRRRWRTWTRKA